MTKGARTGELAKSAPNCPILFHLVAGGAQRRGQREGLVGRLPGQGVAGMRQGWDRCAEGTGPWVPAFAGMTKEARAGEPAKCGPNWDFLGHFVAGRVGAATQFGVGWSALAGTNVAKSAGSGTGACGCAGRLARGGWGGSVPCWGERSTGVRVGSRGVLQGEHQGYRILLHSS